MFSMRWGRGVGERSTTRVCDCAVKREEVGRFDRFFSCFSVVHIRFDYDELCYVRL